MKEYFDTIMNYYQKHKVLIIFTFFGVLIALNIIFTNPAKKDGINTWNDITIGQKTSQSQLDSLSPISVENKGDKTSYKYDSGFNSFPNEVIVSKNQTTQFIKEYLVANKNHTLDYYLEQLGKYDLKLNVPEIGHSVSAAVFLKDGLVVIFDSTSEIKTVVQKWYFEPTSKEQFLETWGETLEVETYEEQPHPAIMDSEL